MHDLLMGNSVQHSVNHVTPPRGAEIELRTLSALIQLGDPKNLRVQSAMLQLDKHCFYLIDHQVVYELISDLFANGKPFDIVELMPVIPDDQYHLVSKSIQDAYCTTNRLEHDIDTLLAYRTYRQQLKTLVNTVNRSFEEKLPREAINRIREEIQGLSELDDATQSSIVRPYELEIDAILTEEVEEVVDFLVNISDFPPVPNRALITIAGRSGHGKTFFALYLMDAIINAQPGKQTLYFNLEMHPRVMIERHAILLGSQGANRKELVGNVAHTLLSKNVSLISVPMITIEKIEAECRLAALREPLCCIVVDYLGLIGSKAQYEAKYVQQNDIAKRLAALSMELDCVVICLIQVNREFNKRPIGNRCPITSDAAESSGSVHSSSWWLGIDQPQIDDNSGEYQDLFMVECRKNRGQAGMFSIKLKFKNGQFSKYERPFSVKPILPPSF